MITGIEFYQARTTLIWIRELPDFQRHWISTTAFRKCRVSNDFDCQAYFRVNMHEDNEESFLGTAA